MDLTGHTEISDEGQLRHMSRNIRDLIPGESGPDVIKQVDAILASVYDAAATSGASVPYRVAAWNALSAALEQCAQHHDANTRHAILIRWWTRVFDLYVAQAHSVRPKSGRQLLTTLATAVRRTGSDPMPKGAMNHACRSMVEPLSRGQDDARVKTCTLALVHFMSTGVVSLDEVMHQYSAVLSGHSTSHETGGQAGIEALLGELFRWTGKADFGSTIGQLISIILDGATHKPVSTQDLSQGNRPDCSLWSNALQHAIQDDSIDVQTLRVHLLPMLFKRSSPDYYIFLQAIGIRGLLDPRQRSTANGDNLQLRLLCASLQAGKDFGILCETDRHKIVYHDGTVNLPIRGVARLLHHSAPIVRLTALSLLITSRTATRPISQSALHAIKRHLGHFFADTDADFRSEVCGLVQRLIDRIRAITAVLARQTGRHGGIVHLVNDAESTETLRYHKDFLVWLSQFLRWELRPTASYQRHITGLKCILIAARSGLDCTVARGNLSKSALGEAKWPFRLHLLSRALCGLLLDRIVDPFDDVRQTAAAILRLYPADSRDCQWQIELTLSRAEHAMLASGRADQADGVAHLYALLQRQRQGDGNTLLLLIERLERMISTAQANLSEAVARYPLHGLLTSMRYILERSQQPLVHESGYLTRLVEALNGIWEIVKPVLCDDAPEGYAPEHADNTEDVSTKDTLSYCWRALKESGMLLSTMLQDSSMAESDNAIKLTGLCFTQLAELRHRGAFSTVAQTWVVCCLASRNKVTVDGQSVLQQYYASVMSILRNKTTINTRRSAGLPSLLCGILIADTDGQLLKQTYADLEAIARDEVASDAVQEGSLPQVHAMNCLKDVLKNSRLGERSEQYVPVALRLAADALQSSAWAVRNCGLMLFRAVIDRLLGTSNAYTEAEARTQRRLSAAQHPQLLETVFGLLESPLEAPELVSARSEGVFPALQLLERLRVPSDRIAAMRQAVRALMGSPRWHVRAKAAHTYATFIGDDEAFEAFEDLLHITTASQNALHGALLCARHINKRLMLIYGHRLQVDRSRSAVQDESPLSMALIMGRMNELYNRNTCPSTKAAYIDLVIDVTISSHRSSLGDVAHPDEPAIVDHVWTLAELRVHMDTGGSTVALRLTLARLLACQLLLTIEMPKDMKLDVRLLLTTLSKHDADACTALFLEATSMFKGGYEVTEGLRTVLESCDDIGQQRNVSLGLRCGILELLSSVDDSRHDVIVSPSAMALDEAMPQSTNQRFLDLQLQWRAACLKRAIPSQDVMSSSLIKHVHDWTDSCVAAVKGEAVHSRDAAALSLARLRLTWKVLSSTREVSREMLSLCMATYDLLNDDDEGIRLLAATTTSHKLACDNSRAYDGESVPAVAGQRLLAFMIRKWSTDPDFVREATHRAFHGLCCGQLNAEPWLQGDAETNKSLFVEEKQNLYIDEAREVKAWSHVLMSLPPTAVPKRLVRHLSLNVAEGLNALIFHATEPNGGSLGWSSHPEHFTLGLQIIYGAQYLLWLSKAGVHLAVRPSTLRYQLANLAFGQSSPGCHALLRDEAEKVLVKSTVDKLFAVHSVLRGIIAW
ncbi:hypothetical protein LTR91_017593 [Friedmanniomyces endolithicus]|uniref:DUF2428 domain-containing protein n=1 Tax=Friedmanniomyces endolithicus TaxID=329885 RepID=A0AAN6K5T6_9PEZI|nr:hypothetical protein LTR94_016681 [Friedmanniomyces endolithicus]KAK0775119.1 hypothetical protein LTR59_014644 [Friedmanniomyces endolithicus]KAK0780660.1 hypothetical protein LTR38_013999 [Friedmanniomyces endolithicus]KAK0791185.1 hypothetical protein LTR75_011837 [Friedmanniomyces endolithicus]KAK0852880.1 hypothetical protein LTS02_012201 [Friedmanniomyces endolithicus]